MTLAEIKDTNIREYLKQKGIFPKKDYGYYGMYNSPFRDDHHTSFKVDYRKNVWHDFGTNEGGSIIDLLMKLNNCTLQEVITDISQYNNTTARQMNNFSFHREAPSTTIQNILPITHPKFIAWIQERKIALNLANVYCREIHYRNRDKEYFSIGFKNDKDGYELCSPPDFKGCISPKEITTFQNASETCLVFEGFWDFLSYLTIQQIETTKHDVAVLNSVANVQKAMDFLKAHKEIYTYLDNDDGGRKATELIKSSCLSVNNRSERYAGFKDLNDYLTGKKQVIEKPKKRGIKL